MLGSPRIRWLPFLPTAFQRNRLQQEPSLLFHCRPFPSLPSLTDGSHGRNGFERYRTVNRLITRRRAGPSFITPPPSPPPPLSPSSSLPAQPGMNLNCFLSPSSKIDVGPAGGGRAVLVLLEKEKEAQTFVTMHARVPLFFFFLFFCPAASFPLPLRVFS